MRGLRHRHELSRSGSTASSGSHFTAFVQPDEAIARSCGPEQGQLTDDSFVIWAPRHVSHPTSRNPLDLMLVRRLDYDDYSDISDTWGATAGRSSAGNAAYKARNVTCNVHGTTDVEIRITVTSAAASNGAHGGQTESK
jgi:hypothetical protein